MDHHAFLIKSAVREDESEPKPGLVAPILGGFGAGMVPAVSAIPVSYLLTNSLMKGPRMDIPGIGDDRTRSELLRSLRRELNVPANVEVQNVPGSQFYRSQFEPGGFKNMTPFERRYFSFGSRPVVRAPLGRPEFLAHELSHSAGPLSRHPILFGSAPMLLKGVGSVVGGYRAAEGENFWKDIGKGGLYGAIGGNLGASPALFEEARASYGALKALKNLSGLHGISPAALKAGRSNLLKAFLTYLTKFMVEGAGSGVFWGGVGHAVKSRSKWNERMSAPVKVVES